MDDLDGDQIAPWKIHALFPVVISEWSELRNTSFMELSKGGFERIERFSLE
jgi:hypothetical protein